MPLALPVSAEGKSHDSQPQDFATLQNRLDAFDLQSLDATDWRFRVAGVISVWTIFQHFHPYLDTMGVKWDEALRPALLSALQGHNAEDFYKTISALVAITQDGHGYVYGRKGTFGGIPIRVTVCENNVVINGVAAETPFKKGDIIEQIDDVPALDLLQERERYAAGSPHLRRYRALNQFGEGAPDSVARVKIARNGKPMTIDYRRSVDKRGYFFNNIGEWEFPAITEVRPGIFYVNISAADAVALKNKMPELAKARGIIFDWRINGGQKPVPREHQIKPATAILPHLIDQTIQASPMMVPLITSPDRVNWTYRESTWPVKPEAPRCKGKIIFITEPSVVSYGETCIAMIADYKLADLVGEPTAGCNGNANFIPLPGGFQVMWTGMDVRKHDHTTFYTIGFKPDHPVSRTLQAIKEGRDEFLEKAIEVIERSTPLPAN